MSLNDSQGTVAPPLEKWRVEIRGAPNTNTPSIPPFLEGESGSMARHPADCPDACNEKSAMPNGMKIGPWLVFLLSFLLVFLLIWSVIIGAMELPANGLLHIF